MNEVWYEDCTCYSHTRSVSPAAEMRSFQMFTVCSKAPSATALPRCRRLIPPCYVPEGGEEEESLFKADAVRKRRMGKACAMGCDEP